MSRKQRLQHAAKAIEKQRLSWGMFAPQIQFETPEGRLARIDEQNEQYFCRLRQYNMQQWLRAGAYLRTSPRHLEICLAWREAKYPKNGTFFCEFIAFFLSGQYDLGKLESKSLEGNNATETKTGR